MNENLQFLVIKLAYSKKTWKERIKYMFYGFLFFPFLKQEERLRQLRGEESSDASSAGDDVYPLF